MSSILLMRKLRLMVVLYNTLKVAQFVGGETDCNSGLFQPKHQTMTVSHKNK